MENPPLSTEEQARQDEWDRFLAASYQKAGYRIVETIQMPSGDIVDWVDTASIPGADRPPPSAPDSLPDGSPLEPSGQPVMEVDLYPELKGPEGTTAIVRQKLAYVKKPGTATSVEEFIANMIPGQPAGQYRLYTGRVLNLISNLSSSTSRMNLWREGNIEDGTFSISEHTATAWRVISGKTYQSIVGVTASRDRANFADDPSPNQNNPLVRLQVESYLRNVTDEIYLKGGWVVIPHALWTPAAGVTYGPGSAYAATLSQFGGAVSSVAAQWKLDSGNWWLWHEGNWLGYFKASDYEFYSGGYGDSASWYGEVFDPTPTNWTDNNMGSGQFASQGPGQAAWMNNMYYCTGASSNCTWLTTAATSLATPADAACYTIDNTIGWDGTQPFFYYGGPGGDSTGCN